MPRQFIVTIWCDQCGVETDDSPTQISMGNGPELETDLCEQHRSELATFLGPYLAKGRRPERAKPLVGEKRPCPWSNCVYHDKSMAKSGLAIHLRKKHRGRLPDGTEYQSQRAEYVREENLPCPHPGCAYMGKNETGVSVHMYRKHGYSAFGKDAQPVPGPDPAGPTSSLGRRTVKKAVASS